MILYKIKEVKLTTSELDIINSIKKLRFDLDLKCQELVNDMHRNNIDVETVQDIMYESGLVDAIGRINVNKAIKNTYKYGKS